MDKLYLDQHISGQFNKELEELRSKVMTMGGMAEEMVGNALKALEENDSELAEEVVEADRRVNDLEKDIDEQANLIIARRQPAASDLRLVISIIKTITDLERVGDEAEHIARLVIRLSQADRPSSNYRELTGLGQHVRAMLQDALDGFARLVPEVAVELVREDKKVDQEYESILRQYYSYMVEDPRTIRRVLDAIWIARSLERIGDHAKNIGEYTIYLVEGKDMRHATPEEMEVQLQEGGRTEEDRKPER